MLYDNSRPAVQRCIEGIETEMSGDIGKASALYQEAWLLSSNDLEYATSAHYLARIQTDAAEALRWNLLALEHAEKIRNEDTAALFPSLYLNAAKAYEDVGSFQQAQHYYLLADKFKEDLPDDGYGEMIRRGIRAGLERVESSKTKA